VLVVDLDFEGVADDKEENPGAFVRVCDEQCEQEGDLLPGLTLKGGAGLTGSVTFEVTGGKGGIQLYSDPQGLNVLPLYNQTILISELPKTFYVKGYVVSPGPRDIEFHVTSNDPAMPCQDKVKLTVVQLKLKSLTFTTDHDLLRDNLNPDDYEPTGDVFPEPKWQAGRQPYEDFPISHTMGQNVGIDAEFELLPPGSNPPDFALSTQGPQGFHFQQDVTLPGGETVVSLTSIDQVEGRIQRIDENSIEWTIRLNGRTALRKVAGPYRIFVTIGTPRDNTDPRHVVTWNRMARAMQQAEVVNSTDPHTLVLSIIGAQGEYYLDGFRPNAWVLPNYPVNFRGDCGSIIRYAKNVAYMIGIPGTYDHIHVYATDIAPETPIEGWPGDGLCTQATSDGFISHPSNPTWKLWLVDESSSRNRYEAAARFSYGEQLKYYPGGVPYAQSDNAIDVLHAFDFLSWYEIVTGSWLFRQIEHTYP
jgi:hypothetical protein